MAYFETMPNGKTRAHVERLGKRKTATWTTKREAEAWARRVETEYLAGKKHGETHSFEDAAMRYMRDVTATKDGARWENLRIPRMIEHFKDAPPIDKIRAEHIAAWRDARLATGVKGSTVLRESKLLHNIFEIARREWRWVETHPFGEVQMPKESDPRTTRWRWQQIRRVLRFLGYVTGKRPHNQQTEVAVAFLVALRTAMRSKEILRTNPNTFNPATRVNQVKRKDGKVSKIPITPQGARVCKLIPDAWTLDDAMRDALFRKARDACLVGDLTFHDSRATALTLLARRYDVLTLSRISGHKNLKMLSDVYYRESPEEIAARLGR